MPVAATKPNCAQTFDFRFPIRDLRSSVPASERWQSGLSYLTRNQAYPKGYRGFESLPLRQSLPSQGLADQRRNDLHCSQANNTANNRRGLPVVAWSQPALIEPWLGSSTNGLLNPFLVQRRADRAQDFISGVGLR